MFGYNINIQEESDEKIKELEEKNRQLKEKLDVTKRVLKDILQCHKINDNIGKRAREILKR